MNTREVIAVFKQAGFSGTVYADAKTAVEALDKNRRMDSILCPYKNEPRFIHPEVCGWHRKENDPECVKQKCERVNSESGNYLRDKPNPQTRKIAFNAQDESVAFCNSLFREQGHSVAFLQHYPQESVGFYNTTRKAMCTRKQEYLRHNLGT